MPSYQLIFLSLKNTYFSIAHIFREYDKIVKTYKMKFNVTILNMFKIMGCL